MRRYCASNYIVAFSCCALPISGPWSVLQPFAENGRRSEFLCGDDDA